MRRFWPMTAIGLVLAVGLGYALSCSSPTRPKEPKDLRLYVTEGWTNNIYVFNPESKTLLDSIYADYPIGMVLSPDGKYLFTAHDAPPAPGRQVLKKIQTATLEIVGEMPRIGEMVFLEHGGILLRQGSGGLEFIDPISFQVTRVDSIVLGGLASSDTLGFVLGVDSWGRLTAYDYREKKILAADSIYFPAGVLLRGMSLALHPCGRNGFGIFRDPYQRAWFLQYTIPELRIEFTYQLVYGFGDIAVSPDGQYVLFNDPGDPWHGSSLHKFYVYDVAQQQISRIFDTDTLALLQEFPNSLIGDIIFSPDGSMAYASSGTDWAYGPILCFDMEQLEFTDEFHINYEWTPGLLAVGTEP